MTPEKQRIAIAEACGYKIIDSPTAEGFVRLQKPDGNPVCSVGEESRDNIWPAAITWNWIPDYLNDLNAVHEAEKTLDDGVLWRGYLNQLWEVVCPERNQMNGLDAATGLLLVHATAAQRAEAFLKTLSLWCD